SQKKGASRKKSSSPRKKGPSQEKDRPLEPPGFMMVPCNREEASRVFPEKASSTRDPRFRLRGAGSYVDILAYGEDGPHCGELKPGTLFDPVFSSNQGAFDGLLLAKKSGEIVYQHEAVDLGVTDVGMLLAKGGSRDSKKSLAEAVASFSSAASYHNVEIGGREHRSLRPPV